MQITKADRKAVTGKKRTHFPKLTRYYFERTRSMMMTQSKVFASLAKRGGKGAFAKRWKRQNQRAMAKEASSKRKTVVTKCEKKANAFPKNVSNFFTPLLAFTKANEFEKRSERAYLEYPVCVVVFISYARLYML